MSTHDKNPNLPWYVNNSLDADERNSPLEASYRKCRNSKRSHPIAANLPRRRSPRWAMVRLNRVPEKQADARSQSR